jgi:hypothetical protein
MVIRTSPRTYVFAASVAALIVGGALVYKVFFEASQPLTRPIPVVGKAGSTHAHASLLIMNGEKIISFCDPKYMLKSDIVHFEDDDCFVVHKHATGVTIDVFLRTLGVEVSSECIVTPNERLCTEGSKKVSVVYNGIIVPAEELIYQEIRNNDHVLINYGDESDLDLRFRYNMIPEIPPEVNM